MRNLLNVLKNYRLTLLGTGLFLAGAFLLSSLSSDVSYPQSDKELAQTSVRIVRSDRRSGGSGVILSSSKNESTILTNGHVCNVVVDGGMVLTETAEHAVKTLKFSSAHDLCLVTVSANLGVQTRLASKNSATYEPGIISGHPNLLPNIVTRGHFSGREIIQVMTGFRKCTKEDLKSPLGAMLCGFLGGMPIIERYESQVVSALISGGSSGSAVFNSDGEITALVFAGSGAISQAYVVPFESVSNFVEIEAEFQDEYLVNNIVDILGTNGADEEEDEEESENAGIGRLMPAPTGFADFTARLSELCRTKDTKLTKEVAEICLISQSDMLWRK